SLEFDFVIAPLADNLFNRCKSGLKFLEYSAIGAPGVYSKLPPYEDIVIDGVTGFLAGTETEWIEKLTRLIEEPELRQNMAVAAQQTVQERWLLSQNITSWEDILKKLNQKYLKEDLNKPLHAHITNTVNRQLYYDRAHTEARQQNLVLETKQLTHHILELNQLNSQKNQELLQLKEQ